MLLAHVGAEHAHGAGQVLRLGPLLALALVASTAVLARGRSVRATAATGAARPLFGEGPSAGPAMLTMAAALATAALLGPRLPRALAVAVLDGVVVALLFRAHGPLAPAVVAAGVELVRGGARRNRVRALSPL